MSNVRGEKIKTDRSFICTVSEINMAAMKQIHVKMEKRRIQEGRLWSALKNRGLRVYVFMCVKLTKVLGSADVQMFHLGM